MNISVIGSGYVGLVTGTCLAEMGNHVNCVDINSKIIERLSRGEIHIYEPGLEEILRSNLKKKNISFTTSIGQAIKGRDIIFIAVGTPTDKDGSVDLEHIFQVARDIGRNISWETMVVNKSTVPVGTADRVREIIEEELKKRNIEIPFDVVSNPEFLKEGEAVSDFMKPDRIIVGANNQDSIKTMRKLYSGFMLDHERFISMDPRSAELTKYAANALLATKISFMNEISNIAEKINANINLVRIGVGSDHRIGYHSIYPGCGFGGSCFPKDVRELIKTASDLGYEASLIKATQEVNENQKLVLVKKVINYFGQDINGKKIAIWGLSFKPNTDDMREAPSIVIINALTSRGGKIQAYDPKAQGQAEQYYLKDNSNITYYEDKYQALNDADCMVLITDWKEFRQSNFDRMKKTMKKHVIFDGRNQYDKQELNHLGFEYFQIGCA